MRKKPFKYRPQKIQHRDAIHVIHGKAHPGSAADYLMLKQHYMKMDDNWMLTHFKKGEQLLFNTKFVKEIQDEHTELHCEICGKKDLVLYMWWEHGNRADMATADHFFPKSYDKDNLSFERNNMIVACDACNNVKADDFYDMSIVRYPYPGTLDNLKALAEKMNFQNITYKEWKGKS